ncbi:MAG TPA: Hpt domain-containing protein [Sedimentisphaerales bacterium]|nr:Hpt domain-containing protein [Sedimentisphaerales bacterium]
MENNDKTSGSLSNRVPRHKCKYQQAWLQLTCEYLSDLPVQLEQIRTVLASNDYVRINRHAHRIKGTAGTFHLQSICQSAAQLEHFADSRNKQAVVSAVKEIARLVELESKKRGLPTVFSGKGSESNENG